MEVNTFKTIEKVIKDKLNFVEIEARTISGSNINHFNFIDKNANIVNSVMLNDNDLKKIKLIIEELSK